MAKVKRQKEILSESEIIKKAQNHTRENPADFSNHNISGYDLSGFDLYHASFAGAVCFGTKFEECDLTGCDFTGADRLNTVDFHKCRMDEGTARSIINLNGSLPNSVKVFDGNGNIINIDILWGEALDYRFEQEFLKIFFAAVESNKEKKSQIIEKAKKHIRVLSKDSVKNFREDCMKIVKQSKG